MEYCFGKPYRLLKTDDFSSVFALRRLKSRPDIQLWHKPNGLAHPRLGLVVAKKTARRANRRNYMKRVIREWFRRHQCVLPPHDFVVRVRKAFDKDSAPQARQELCEMMLPPTAQKTKE